MNIASRIGDQGIIGTFFLLLTVSGFLVVEPEYFEQNLVGGASVLNSIFSAAPSLATPIASLVAVLGLISVFFIGLVIDFLGFYAPALEVVTFKKKIDQHRTWLLPLLNENQHLLSHEIKVAIEDYHPTTSVRMGIKQLFTTIPFSRRYWQIAAQNWKFVKIVADSKRLLDFLICKGLESASNANSQLLLERYRLWRTSRALSTSLIIAAMEILFLGFANDGVNIFKILIIYTICWFLAMGLTLRSFNQVCETTLALVYIDSK